MPTPTTELGLQKALDADDTADYLDTYLANSLGIIDSLFNNVTGHTHGDVHQGGPISTIPASAIPDGSITSVKIQDGTIQLVDLAPATYTLGGDLSGTIQAGHVSLANNSPINGADSGGTQHRILGVSTNDTYLFAGAGNIIFYADGVGQLASLDRAGNFGATGFVSAHTIIGNNLDIQEVRTYYGMGNSVYLTNDGNNWNFHGGVSMDTFLTLSAGNFNQAQYGTYHMWGGTGSTSIYCDNSMMQFAHTGLWRHYNPSVGYFDVHATNLSPHGIGSVGMDLQTYSISAQNFVPSGSTAGFFTNSTRSGASSNEVAAIAHLYVPGSVWCTNVQTSSVTIKNDLQPILPADALGKVMGVTPYSFVYNDPPPEGTLRLTDRHLGFTAEDMAKVVPEAVALTDTGTGPAPAGITYTSLVPLLWGAVQSLQQRLATLEAKAA